MCLGILPQICLGIPPQIMSENTASKKTRSTAPIVFFYFNFLDTTAKLFKSIPLECVVYPLDFYFSYVYSCSPLASFLVYVVGLRERSRRYFAHLCVISPCVCSVREIGGVGVGGEDFAFL